MDFRKKTKQVLVGGLPIGGGAPVVVQSMTNTDTRDAKATLGQIDRLAQAGCQLVRCTVPDMEAAEAMKTICARSSIPIAADIHFDYRLALAAVSAGAHKIRLNPGNIGGMERVRAVAQACMQANVPIRVGVNSGSVERELLQKYGGPTAQALAESALNHAAVLEECGFDKLVLSVKSSSVPVTVQANCILSEKTAYPLHLGVTEAGTAGMGSIKSAAGIGGLLALGIGDTIRVSLTDDPVREIGAAYSILKAVGLASAGVDVVSCPTCGRTKIDLIAITQEVERRTAGIKKKMKIAVMGCAVNGPGEAREADVGIAGGDGEGLVFRRGEIIRKVPQEHLVDALMEEVRAMEAEIGNS